MCPAPRRHATRSDRDFFQAARGGLELRLPIHPVRADRRRGSRAAAGDRPERPRQLRRSPTPPVTSPPRTAPTGSSALDDRRAAEAYAAVRMPATFAAAARAIAAGAERLPGFEPASLLDLGAGPGATSWAATRGLADDRIGRRCRAGAERDRARPAAGAGSRLDVAPGRRRGEPAGSGRCRRRGVRPRRAGFGRAGEARGAGMGGDARRARPRRAGQPRRVRAGPRRSGHAHCRGRPDRRAVPGRCRLPDRRIGNDLVPFPRPSRPQPAPPDDEAGGPLLGGRAVLVRRRRASVGRRRSAATRRARPPASPAGRRRAPRLRRRPDRDRGPQPSRRSGLSRCPRPRVGRCSGPAGPRTGLESSGRRAVPSITFRGLTATPDALRPIPCPV